MKHYTSTIPFTLAEKLKEKGMPITMSYHLHQPEPNVKGLVQANFKEIDCPSYAEVFDWLMERAVFVTIPPIGKLEDGPYRFEATITYDDATDEEYLGGYTWHDAANAAIEKALELIKK